MERRLLERLGATKTKDMEGVRESETFSAPEINIRVPLAIWIDLIGKGIKESSKEELLFIWSMALKSVTQVLEAMKIKAKLELHSWEDNRETWEVEARGMASVRKTWVDFLFCLSACLSL